jgi:Ras-related protein Rab-11A
MPALMKITIDGDDQELKTALRERYLGRGFQSKYMMTIGADFALKETVIDGRAIKFQIWDLASSPRFSAVRSVYYLGCLGAIIIYDAQNPESFQNLPIKIREIWTNNGKGVIPIALYAIVKDRNKRKVSTEAGYNYVNKLNELISYPFRVAYFEGSAKKGENITEIFKFLARSYFYILNEESRRPDEYLKIEFQNYITQLTDYEDKIFSSKLIKDYQEQEQILKVINKSVISSYSIKLNNFLINCQHCGNKISVLLEKCEYCQEPLRKCEICQNIIEDLDTRITCIGCTSYFHEDHLKIWLSYQGTCPVCRTNMI